MEEGVAENQGSASGKLLGNLGHAELYPSVIFYRVKYFLRKKKKGERNQHGNSGLGRLSL